MKSKNELRILLIISSLAVFTLVPQAVAADDPGIQNKNELGAVPIGDRFMVRYQEAIPGTEVTFTMIPIAGGEFLMGSAPSEQHRSEDEGPQHLVRVKPFWMSECEVTWAEYQRFMAYYDIFKSRPTALPDDKRADAVTSPTPLYDPTFTYALGEEPRQPAVTMTQYAARQYSKWISLETGRFYRLPTETEWEYACRAGSKAAYAWGDDPEQLDAHAWYYDNSDDTYHDVGQKAANAWGLHDMHGNVAEYVLDGLAPYAETADGSVQWPKKLFGRVIRGGSWQSDAEDLRCAARAADEDWRVEDPNLPKSPWWFTDEQALCVGFRLVRPWHTPGPEERAKAWDADVEELIEDVDFRVSEGRGVFGTMESDEP